jgi:heme-degrading monooxygenase HmoA
MDLVSRPAFERLAPAPGLYATMPIAEAFDWASCADDAGASAGEWYLVCFRSIRQPGADEALLQALDDLAHLEASTAPGFVHYFKGQTTEHGECLSFCLWDSRADARAAAGRPAHAQASAVVHQMYASYTLEFYRVTKGAGRRSFEFEPYDRPAPPAQTRLS